MASKTKKAKQTPDTDDEVIATPAENSEESEATDDQAEETAPDAPAVNAGIHDRLVTVAETAAYAGNADSAHALCLAESVTGQLKALLPDAISAVTDDALKSDLQNLLASL